MRRIAPVFVLLFLSPAVAEVLLGSTPLSKLSPVTFLLYIGFYGAGAVLIRELVRRRGLGWSRIILLALAFGLLEEGLVTQSLFNPHYPGLGYLGTYGRWLGVNWYWTEYILGWHAVWSISLPILLTELLFPTRQSQPWLGRIGLWMMGVIFVLSGFAFVAINQSFAAFMASPSQLACTALMVVGLVFLALFIPRGSFTTSSQRSGQRIPSRWLIGFIALVTGIIWLGNHKFISPTFILPAQALIPLLAALVVAVVFLIRRWSVQDIRLALTTGGCLAGEFVGLKIVQNGTTTDLVILTALCGVTVVLLALFNWRAYKQGVETRKFTDDAKKLHNQGVEAREVPIEHS